MPLELEELTERIVGAAIEVHRILGPGFLESIYEKALEVELNKRALRVACQVPITIYYDEQPVGLHRIDMLVEREVVLD